MIEHLNLMIGPSNLDQAVDDHIRAVTVAMPIGGASSANYWRLLTATHTIEDPGANWHEFDMAAHLGGYWPERGARIVMGTLSINDTSGDGSGLAEGDRQPWVVSYRPLGNIDATAWSLSGARMGLTKPNVRFAQSWTFGPDMSGSENGRGIEINVGDALGGYTRMTSIAVAMQIAWWVPM